MIRTAAIFVTLLAQVISTFAQGAFVLCVHNDGQSRIEFACATCCRDGSGRCHCGAACGSNQDQTTPSDDCQPCDCTNEEDHERCCDSCSGDGARRANAVAAEGLPGRSFLVGCACCTDYPIVTPALFVSAEPRQRLTDINRGMPSLTAVVFDSTGLRLDSASLSSFCCCGPPCWGAPAHLATTVLRC